jgi:hypothetical protein
MPSGFPASARNLRRLAPVFLTRGEEFANRAVIMTA